jgi:hypothetical protein
MKKTRKKTEMSKILLIVSDVITSVTVILTFVAVFWMKDISPLAFLIPGVFGLSSIAHGFYFWKAKAENLHKFGQDNKITMSGEEDPSGSDFDDGSVG